MLRQKKKHRPALWAVAFAAAPISAHAGAINPPGNKCTSQNRLGAIAWTGGPNLRGNGVTIGATELRSGSPTFVGTNKGEPTPTVPFVCVHDNADLKVGVAPGSVASIFATATLDQGNAFLIDFGAFTGTAPSDNKLLGSNTKAPVEFTPELGSTATYDTVVSSGGHTKFDSGALTKTVVTTDFNLYLNATNPTTNQLLWRDYLGVQVNSGVSALSGSDRFYVSTPSRENHGISQLIFDPTYSGPTTVKLLRSPDPLAPTSAAAPEPGTLSLLAAGLAGLLLAVVRGHRMGRRDGPEA